MTRSISGKAALRAGFAVFLAIIGISATMMVLSAAGWAAQPQDWELGMQPPATPVKERIQEFHNELLVIITLITVFVMGLLGYAMYRFSAKRHPVPTRTSHNTVIEILWTVVPVVILVLIAIPSFKLMYFMDRVPTTADMTIKVTGNQWFWNYEYPDQGVKFDSNLIQEKDLKPGQKRLLDVDNPLVVPVNAIVRVQVAGVPDGVIHSWFVPSFGVQEYAMPGRLNESWFKVEHEGTYYGECNQICGINHAFMPIEIKAVAKADFDKWLADAKKKFATATPEAKVAGAAPGEDTTLVAAAARTDVRPAQAPTGADVASAGKQ
ncbi:MAG TPA: cytochrome c oxidase subunit II [Stellaceae bacterium]|nr:cytochrome c oxidase subunit II [Stellaceae bacterium]